MKIFIERFILGILAPLVVLFATNPVGLTWPLRIIGIIVTVIVAGIAAYFAGWDEWRWERLRALWWLWSIFGLSSGVTLALWLSPQFLGPPPPTPSQPQALIIAPKPVTRTKHILRRRRKT